MDTSLDERCGDAELLANAVRVTHRTQSGCLSNDLLLRQGLRLLQMPQLHHLDRGQRSRCCGLMFPGGAEGSGIRGCSCNRTIGNTGCWCCYFRCCWPAICGSGASSASDASSALGFALA